MNRFVSTTEHIRSTLRSWLHKISARIKFCPLIGEQPYTKMLISQFSNIIIYVKIVGKIPYQRLSVWLFSNPGDTVQIHVESTGQICPVLLHLFWTLSPGFDNNCTFKCGSGIFPTIATYMNPICLKLVKCFLLLFCLNKDQFWFLFMLKTSSAELRRKKLCREMQNARPPRKLQGD